MIINHWVLGYTIFRHTHIHVSLFHSHLDSRKDAWPDGADLGSNSCRSAPVAAHRRSVAGKECSKSQFDQCRMFISWENVTHVYFTGRIHQSVDGDWTWWFVQMILGSEWLVIFHHQLCLEGVTQWMFAGLFRWQNQPQKFGVWLYMSTNYWGLCITIITIWRTIRIIVFI